MVPDAAGQGGKAVAPARLAAAAPSSPGGAALGAVLAWAGATGAPLPFLVLPLPSQCICTFSLSFHCLSWSFHRLLTPFHCLSTTSNRRLIALPSGVDLVPAAVDGQENSERSVLELRAALAKVGGGTNADTTAPTAPVAAPAQSAAPTAASCRCCRPRPPPPRPCVLSCVLSCALNYALNYVAPGAAGSRAAVAVG